MKIKAEKWIIEKGVTSYKLKSIEKCCDKLINSKNICLNDKYIADNIEGYRYSVRLFRTEDLEENWVDYHYETIEYCPFCGEPINIEIIDEVDKREECKLLIAERDRLWKKCCNTDSKKEASNLREQVSELDENIDKMYRSDDFEREENYGYII
jgi:hypothetical protein